jgi:hypothetical protein
MSTQPKRGRPMKTPEPGTRAPLSLMVRPAIKQSVDAAARASGRTQSQEAELLIEQGLAVHQALVAMGTTVPELARRLAEKNFRDRGYTVIHDPHGDIWLPPGHPSAPPSSGFVPPEKVS